MFYQEALPTFRLLSHVDSLLTIGDRHWWKLTTAFEKAESAKFISICMVTGAFSRGVPIFYGYLAYFLWVLINTM